QRHLAKDDQPAQENREHSDQGQAFEDPSSHGNHPLFLPLRSFPAIGNSLRCESKSASVPCITSNFLVLHSLWIFLLLKAIRKFVARGCVGGWQRNEFFFIFLSFPSALAPDRSPNRNLQLQLDVEAFLDAAPDQFDEAENIAGGGAGVSDDE